MRHIYGIIGWSEAGEFCIRTYPSEAEYFAALANLLFKPDVTVKYAKVL